MSKISVLLTIFVIYNILVNIFLIVVVRKIKKITIEYREIFEDYQKLIENVREDKYDMYRNADGLYTNQKGVTQSGKFRGIKRE